MAEVVMPKKNVNDDALNELNKLLGHKQISAAFARYFIKMSGTVAFGLKGASFNRSSNLCYNFKWKYIC